MEEHPYIIERVQLYMKPNSLCKARDEYIGRAAIRVVTSSVTKFEFFAHIHGSPANKFNPIHFAQRIWLNIGVDSLNNVGMLIH